MSQLGSRSVTDAGCSGEVSLFRRQLMLALIAAPVVLSSRAMASASISVWTGPSCSCCHGWIEHLKQNGFNVETHDGGNSAARARLGMPVRYGSCHTAELDGYAIEGHVPAQEINRLMQERPEAVGIAVPAMPVGSPGMDGSEYGGRRDPYDVLLVRRDGRAEVYQSYR